MPAGLNIPFRPDRLFIRSMISESGKKDLTTAVPSLNPSAPAITQMVNCMKAAAAVAITLPSIIAAGFIAPGKSP